MKIAWSRFSAVIWLLSLLTAVNGDCEVVHPHNQSLQGWSDLCHGDLDFFCTGTNIFVPCCIVNNYMNHCGQSIVINVKINPKTPTYVWRPVEQDLDGNEFDRYTNNVKSMDISFNNINVIPINMFNYEYLRSLNISHNEFTWVYFNEFYRFLKLEHLDISHNAIVSLEIIPPQIDYSDVILPRSMGEGTFNMLKKLNVGHNRIQTIADDFFRSFIALKWLDLSNNQISILDSSTFQGLAHISFLDLSFNHITTLNFAFMRISSLKELYLQNNNITSLSALDFTGLNRLTDLRLNNNFLKTLTKDLFGSLDSLENINMSKNLISEVVRDTFVNNEKLFTVDLSENGLRRIEAGSFRNNKHILNLYVKGNQLEGSIQISLFGGLTEVTQLDLSYHNFAEIEQFAFFGLYHLSILNISHGLLECISNSAFKSLNMLKKLDLSGNKLPNVTFDFTDLNQLNWLSVSNNRVHVIFMTTLSEITSLEYLDVSQNNIVNFGTEMFTSLHNLIFFNIADNPISGSINQNTFRNLKALPRLDLSNTTITSVKNGSLIGMEALTKLDISHSNLSEVEYNAFAETGQIMVIDLSHNVLTCFMVNNSQINTINVLILSHNLITILKTDSFKQLNNLEIIDVSDNNIVSIEKDTFGNLSNLIKINLANNKELNFSLSSFNNLPHLKYLSLSGIKKTFNFMLFPNNSINLSNLFLESNEINDIGSLHLSGIPRLRTLEISTNNIAVIKKDAFLEMKLLETISVSVNKVSVIEPGSFRDIEFLIFLNLSHNRLSTIPYGTFNGLRNLQTLDLSFNSIREINSHRLYGMHQLSNLILDNNLISDLHLDRLVETAIASISVGDNLLPCSMLVDYKRKQEGPPYLTSLILRHSGVENVEGISCKGESHFSESTVSNPNMTLNKLTHNSEVTNNILNDVKVMLSNIFLNNSQSNARDVDLEHYLNKINALTENSIQKISDKIINNTNEMTRDASIQMKIYNEIKTENFHIDNILKHLHDFAMPTNMSFSSISPVRHEENISDISINNARDIENIKKDFKQYVADERKTLIKEMKEYFSETIRKHDSVLATLANYTSNNNTTRPSRADKLTAPQSSSMKFIEASVAILLIIVVTVIALYMYKSRKMFFRNRSASSQQISTTIEM